jgi:hypothetical protein
VPYRSAWINTTHNKPSSKITRTPNLEEVEKGEADICVPGAEAVDGVPHQLTWVRG